MKKTILPGLFAMLLFANNQLNAQNVNIPNANFKAALVANTAINTNADTEIQVTEAQAFAGTMDVSSKSITSMTGIEAFTALTDLRCNNNQLTSLNVSANTALTYLYCNSNQLTSLNVSANTILDELNCSSNQLTSLNVSTNTALTDLRCNSNQLTSLNVSANTALDWLNCSSNAITSLNVSANTALTRLYCSSNQLTSLNVSTNTALTFLHCYSNQLTSLGVSTNTVLISFYCYNNQLTSLDVSANTTLTTFFCYNNQLTSLNVSANTALTTFYCNSNQLTSLNAQNGNNINMPNGNFFANNNPNLVCIQVDSVAYSVANWTGGIDGTATFNTVCNTSIETISPAQMHLTAYPNPFHSTTTIDFGTTITDAELSIYNMFGQKVKTISNISDATISLNRAELSSGFYVLHLIQNKKVVATGNMVVVD